MHFSHELERVIAAARRSDRDRDPGIRQRIAQARIGLRTMRCACSLAMDVLGEAERLVSDDPLTWPLQQLYFFSCAARGPSAGLIRTVTRAALGPRCALS